MKTCDYCKKKPSHIICDEDGERKFCDDCFETRSSVDDYYGKINNLYYMRTEKLRELGYHSELVELDKKRSFYIWVSDDGSQMIDVATLAHASNRVIADKIPEWKG